MKLRELAKAAKVPKETIQYYLREGLLPKPPLRSKRVAEYDENYIEWIGIIRELQDNHFLPIALIKEILKKQRKASPLERSLFRMHSQYFSPLIQLLPKEITGEDQFLEATGLGAKWLPLVEAWGIITPTMREGRKVYAQEDVTLGRLLVEMDKLGVGPKAGFEMAPLKTATNAFREMVTELSRRFPEVYLEKLTDDEFFEMGTKALEIFAIYFYHLYRKIGRESVSTRIKGLKNC